MSKRDIEALVGKLVSDSIDKQLDDVALAETVYKEIPGIMGKTDILDLIRRRRQAEAIRPKGS